MQYTLHDKTINTKIIASASYDPWYNLALEEYLLNTVEKNEIILYLWQNENTVVIGRNQNPWKECKCRILESDGGKLARRLSGGGAVYHDLGNLNFTFIMDKKLYDLHKQLKVIINAVNKMGIKAEFTGRNDITVNGKKISGNAFYFKEVTAYHHGTILIDSNMDKLVDYLQVSTDKIVSKGVDSVRSRVINLKEMNPNIDIPLAKKAVFQSFLGIYGGSCEEIYVLDEEVNQYYNKYASWEWRYGHSPKFDLTLSNRFCWGGVELGMSFKDGNISNCKIYSDSLAVDLVEKISNTITGLPLDMGVITDAITSIVVADKQEEEIKRDLSIWLSNQSL